MSTQLSTTTAPYIPDTAPFSASQRAWLNGFLAGLYSTATAYGAPAATAQAEAKIPLTILYGSETGNTESLAKKTAKAAENKGFEVKLESLASYNKESITEESDLLLLTSTYGDGEPPDTAADFYEFIHSDSAPRLENLRYSVLALGDTSYAEFCKCGKDFDKRFEELGGQRVFDRVDCDVDFDEPFENWQSGVFEKLSANGSSNGAAVMEPEVEAEPTYTKKNPFPAKITRHFNLNGEGSSKETHHIEISLEGSGLSYEPGDALGVYPKNCPEYVVSLLEAVGLEGSVPVNGKSLKQALIEDYEITKLTPLFIKAYASLVDDAKLKEFAGNESAKLADYCWGREIIDLMTDYPYSFDSAETLVSIFKKLQPRLYSISSSPRAHDGEVHLTVGIVRYVSNGRSRKGVCSTFLSDRCCDESLPIFLHYNDKFRLPEDTSKPVIMVGPGTGIAPFRAFLEERQSTGSKGKNWLFFGDQHVASDFLYQEQLDKLQKDGFLHRLDTAFSRDQKEKVYVQDKMREAAAELFAWLEEGAYFFVCGDASRMAKDVDKALHDIIAEQGNMDEAAAAAYVKQLKADKRYGRDVY